MITSSVPPTFIKETPLFVGIYSKRSEKGRIAQTRSRAHHHGTSLVRGSKRKSKDRRQDDGGLGMRSTITGLSAGRPIHRLASAWVFSSPPMQCHITWPP